MLIKKKNNTKTKLDILNDEWEFLQKEWQE